MELLIGFGAAVVGAIAGFLANFFLGRLGRRLEARSTIYYRHINGIYDMAWDCRARAADGRRVWRRKIKRLERITREIEMESRRTRCRTDMDLATRLHTAMLDIAHKQHNGEQVGRRQWDRAANALRDLNAYVGAHLA